MMETVKMKKGQIVYRVNLSYNFIDSNKGAKVQLSIIEQVIDSCGKKQITFQGDTGQTRTTEYHEVLIRPFFGTTIEYYHADKAEAEAEAKRLLDIFNNTTKLYEGTQWERDFYFESTFINA